MEYKDFLGLTRYQLVELLGEADAVSIGTRKYPTPSIYKYGDIGYYFGPYKDSKLFMVFEESTHTILAKN